MAKILMVWEMGQNYGHVLPLLSPATVLKDQGHTVVFALKDLRHAGAYVVAAGFAAIQAPAHPDKTLHHKGWQPQSMAEILLLFGFGDPAVLGLYLRAWRELMCLLGTDLVVASYSPTALLAARTLGLKTCLTGMPFELPPPVTPSPSFRPLLETSAVRLVESENLVVRGVNAAVSGWGLAIEAVWQVFAANRQVLWTFPPLDPFAGRRKPAAGSDVEYSGAIFNPSLGGPASWPERDGPRIFGYLRFPALRLKELISSFSRADTSFSLIVPSLTDEEVKALAIENVQLSNKPVELATTLNNCSAVLNYGGHGTICASLLAGRPLILLAEQMADVLLSQRVVKLRAAALPDPRVAASILSACREVIAEPSYRLAAERFRDRYKGYDVRVQTRRLADLLHGMLV